MSIAVKTFGVCDFSRLAVMDWRLRRWRLWFLALMTATHRFLLSKVFISVNVCGALTAEPAQAVTLTVAREEKASRPATLSDFRPSFMTMTTDTFCLSVAHDKSEEKHPHTKWSSVGQASSVRLALPCSSPARSIPRFSVS